MNDNTKTWRSSTTTRSWSSTTDLTPEQRTQIEALLDGGIDGVTVSESWRYSGTENGETFNVQIDDGAVTVNGRRYDSLDEVPRAERERIEALRNGQGMEGLWDMLRNSGLDSKDLSSLMPDRQDKPVFTIETKSPDASAIQSPRTSTENLAAGSAPGAVPPGGGLRKTLLIGIAIGLALWVAQALKLF
ncbi:hypothetical protein ABE599_04765 [Achromobacter mucicolens]|uniref:hypothetical protein n=1 Tax=Achromobacter mucicolens TaxID=1389922 RepID=UPI0032082434